MTEAIEPAAPNPGAEPAPAPPTVAGLLAYIKALSEAWVFVSPEEGKELQAAIAELSSEERQGRITGNLYAAGVINRRRHIRRD